MYFGLSEEQKSLEENINRFLADNASLDTIKAVANGEEDKAQSVHQGILDLGLSGLVIPEEYGGLELNMLFATVVAAALGSGTAPVPYAGSYVMAPLAINLAGSDDQKNQWLPKIAGGECVIGVGLSEYVGAREDAGIEFSNGKLSGRCLFLIDGKKIECIGEGNGPVNALDNAIRSNFKKVEKYYNFFSDLKLLDYKVRILNTGTAATTRVLIESTDKSGVSWFTIGVSPNIIEASFKALLDSLDYKLYKEKAPANLNEK